jgi:hypothetical protein
MEELNKLEEKLGKYEHWKQETLAEIVSDDDLIQLLTPEVIVELLANRENDILYPVFLPVKFGFDLRASKAAIEEQLIALNEDNKSLEDFKAEIAKIKEIDNPIYRLAVYITEIATYGEDHDLSQEKEDIVKTIDELEELLEALSLDEGFQVVTEILDILFPFRELYMERYDENLLEDRPRIDAILEAVNHKTNEMLEYLKKYEEEQKESEEDKEE